MKPKTNGPIIEYQVFSHIYITMLPGMSGLIRQSVTVINYSGKIYYNELSSEIELELLV